MSNSTVVPTNSILEFLDQATKALESISYSDIQHFIQNCDTAAITTNTTTATTIRQYILQKQKECLSKVVVNNDDDINFTEEDLQNALSNFKQKEQSASSDDNINNVDTDNIQKASERLNQEARRTFCKLLLYAQIQKEKEKNNNDSLLINSGEMKVTDIMEFCGLCKIVVKFDFVKMHLCKGIPLFDDDDDTSTTIFPQKRLERIQRYFLKGLGYNPDFGTQEINRMFFTTTTTTNNKEITMKVRETFYAMSHDMNIALAEATAMATTSTISNEFDVNKSIDDGVTRVVSVQHSEKVIDAVTGETITECNNDNSVPKAEYMTEVRSDDEMKEQQLNAARQAAILQQELLGELLTMREEIRNEKLNKARIITQNILQHITELPSQSERVTYITTLQPEIQRQMAMVKLWDTMLAANGGKPPEMR